MQERKEAPGYGRTGLILEKRGRQRSALEIAIGPRLASYFERDDVREIDVNDDGTVWIEVAGRGTEQADFTVSPHDAELLVNTIASEIAISDPSASLSETHQALDGKLDFREGIFARVSLTAPPAVAQHTLELRKHSSVVIPLEAMLQPAGGSKQPLVTYAQYDALLSLLEQRANIVVIGEMFSGKTTFMNALLKKIAEIDPMRRYGYIEHVRELVCPIPNKKAVLATKEWPIERWLEKAVRWNLRSISIGELRDPNSVNLLLHDMWQQGHDGGLTSFHAGSWQKALGRMEAMIRTIGITPQRELIASAIGAIVEIKYAPAKGRIVTGIYALDGVAADGSYNVKLLGEERYLQRTASDISTMSDEPLKLSA